VTDQTTRVMADLVEQAPSSIHGTGVFARSALAAGDLIGVYEGDPTEVDGTFVLWVDDNESGDWRGIDGTGVLRFLNHSQTPNVEFDGPDLYAFRDITSGDELCFDYGDDWAHVP
jgi:SET domain-containing protein